MGLFKLIIEKADSFFKKYKKLYWCFVIAVAMSVVLWCFSLRFWAVWFSFVAIFCVLLGGYIFYADRLKAKLAAASKDKAQTIWGGLLDYGSRLILLTIGCGLAFEGLIFILNDLLGKNIQHWDLGNWTYITAIVGGLGTLGAAIGQLQNSLKQQKNTEEQIELSRDTLAETQTNNLAKLFTDATKLLGGGTTEAENRAALSILEIVADGLDGFFRQAIIGSLKDFILRKQLRTQDKSIPQDEEYIISHNYNAITTRIDDISYRTLCFINKLSMEAKVTTNLRDLTLKCVVDGGNLTFPLEYIEAITYSGVSLKGKDITKFPKCAYEESSFENCIIGNCFLGLGNTLKSCTIQGAMLSWWKRKSKAEEMDKLTFIDCRFEDTEIFSEMRRDDFTGRSFKFCGCKYNKEYITDKYDLKSLAENGVKPY